MLLLVHTKTHDVYRGIRYAVNKEGAILIGRTFASDDPAEASQEALFVQPLNEDIVRQLYHGKLGTKTGTKLASELWEVVTIDLSDGLGYEEHPYILPRHTDQDHDHVHALWLRTNEDGVCIHDSWDHYKAQVVLREIEEHYGLPKLEFSWESTENARSFAEARRAEEQQKAYEQGLRDRPADLSVRQQLLKAIKENVADQPRLPELIERLQDQGIEVKVDLSRPGISFQLQGVKFQGSSLGRGFSFNGLQKHFQVQYDSAQDDAQIEELMERPVNIAELNPERDILVESTGGDFELADEALSTPADEESPWNTVQKLIEPYQFDIDLIRRLYEEELLAIDKKRLAFGTRTLDDTEKSSLALTPEGSFEEISTKSPESTFWLARNEFIDRSVIVANPLEAIATYSIEEDNPEAGKTLYLVAMHPDEIPKDLLQQSEKVYLSASCNEDIQAAVKAANPDSRIIDPDHENGWIGQWRLQAAARSLHTSLLPQRESKQVEIEL